MKAVVCTRIWTARRSSVDGREMPVPKDNEVLIKVYAVSRNASD
jgi:NADPH:quinone reductase-like Zn-dependent oxidoreductase